MKNILIKSIGAWINFLARVSFKKAGVFAFNVLVKVRSVAISDKGEAFFEAGTQHFFEVNGVSSVLHQWGNGSKKLLFLHGWESNSQRWMPYYEKLDMSKYTMYALDAPGHGMARGNALNMESFRLAILYSLEKINDVDTIIGHSLSNTAVNYMYLMNPEVNVKKFIVMGAASGIDAIFIYFKNMLGLSNKSEAALGEKVNTILKMPHLAITLDNFLKMVKQPVLVIHDEEDAITPYAPIKKALKTHPKIKNYITKGLKHDLKSEAVYHSVLDFIAAG